MISVIVFFGLIEKQVILVKQSDNSQKLKERVEYKGFAMSLEHKESNKLKRFGGLIIKWKYQVFPQSADIFCSIYTGRAWVKIQENTFA